MFADTIISQQIRDEFRYTFFCCFSFFLFFECFLDLVWESLLLLEVLLLCEECEEEEDEEDDDEDDDAELEDEDEDDRLRLRLRFLFSFPLLLDPLPSSSLVLDSLLILESTFADMAADLSP